MHKATVFCAAAAAHPGQLFKAGPGFVQIKAFINEGFINISKVFLIYSLLIRRTSSDDKKTGAADASKKRMT